MSANPSRPRQAQTSDIKHLEVRYKYWSPYNVLRSDTPKQTMKSYVESKMHGVDTAQFAKLKRNGSLLPFTPWYQFRSEGEVLSGVNDTQYKNSGVHVRSAAFSAVGSGDYMNVLPISETYVAQFAPYQYSHTVTNAAAKIYEKGWDALTFLAEFSQVKSLFQSVLNTLKRGKLTFPPNWRRLSSAWLSYRYGWRPLVSDIIALNHLVSSKRQKKVSRHRAHAIDAYSTQNSLPGSATYTQMVVGYDISDDIEVSMRGGVIADMYVPEIQFNPLQTGWELIPFSFVVDWLLNVGRSISALAVITGSAAYVSAAGYRITVKRELEYYIIRPTAAWLSGSFSCSAKAEASMTRRTPCSIPYIPRPSVRLDVSKLIDLVALITQRLK